MEKRLLFYAICLLLVNCSCMTKNDPSAKVSLTKDSWLRGEPIEVRISFSNPTDEAIVIPIQPTTIGIFPDADGIRFDTAVTSLQPRSTPEYGWYGWDVSTPLVPVAPGGKWATSVYLQRFLFPPEPGQYQLPYVLKVPYCVRGLDKPQRQRYIQSKGMLSFTIEPSETKKLEAALKPYEVRLQRSEFWTRREAIEALSLVEDPVVVPHLLTMYTLGETDYALRALARFPNNRDAEAAVMAALDSKHDRDVTEALEVLTEWNYLLKTSELRALLDRDDEVIHKATLRYLRTVLGGRLISVPH